MRRVSLREVAERSGVSVNTASRILRGEAERHRPETAAKVRQVAEELGYRPNLLVRGLLAGRSKTVGVVVDVDTESFTVQLFRGVHDGLVERDYAPLVLLASPGISLLDQIHRLVDRRVDGFVLRQGADWMVDTDLAEVWRHDVPVVTVDWPMAESRHADFVGTDDLTGGRLAAQHLLKLGHRRLAYAHRPFRPHVAAKFRTAGFTAAVAAYPGARAVTQLVEDAALEAGCEQLLRLDPRPTAIACSTDIIARALIAAARRHGLRVPEDLSVVGFADLDFAESFDPPLTTLRQDAYAIGRFAALRLVDRIEGLTTEPTPWKLELAPELIVRSSSGPAPASVPPPPS